MNFSIVQIKGNVDNWQHRFQLQLVNQFPTLGRCEVVIPKNRNWSFTGYYVNNIGKDYEV